MSKTLIKKKSLKRDETSALVKSVAHPKTKISVFIASLSLAASVGAAPSGEQVVAGSASFAREGASLEVQNTNGTIINWQDFSIAQDEMVRFLQSGADSAVLNRVISGIPSEILGSLTSNGRVFLINPNGLVIGDGATIDTASFVASTLNISNADFLAGNLHFEGDGGAIENHGYIASGPGGEVVLIAPTVENHGLIQSEDGRILLAAGREVTLHSLNEGGISYRVSAPGDKVLNLGELVASNGSVKVFADQIFQSGTISANRAYRDAEGRVVLEADNELSVSGRITVTGEGVDGGSIHLLGDQVDVVGAEIDASGESGGEILIGGDYQGKGDVKNAENTNVDESTTIRADAGNNGDGGRVIIWSDDTTNSFARITARGGLVSGDGGFVETSGKKILNFGQPVDVSAINGRAGTWLLDPEDITIGDSEAASISTALNGGSNVEVRTTDEGDGEGNIYVNSAITKTEGDSEVTLTLDAHNRVEINAPIRTTAGPLNVTIKTGRAVASTTDNTVDQESTANQTDEPVEDNEAPQDDAIEQDNEAVVQDEETSVETESEGEPETSEEATEEVVADATQGSDEDQETQDQPDEAVESDEVAVTEDEQAGDAESTDTAATEEEAQASSDEAVAQEGESDASAESTEDVASQETSAEATEEPAAEEASTESSVAADTTETPSTETETDTGDSVAVDASESVETSTSEEVASDTTTEAGDVASDDGASDVEAPEVEIETVEVPDVAAETEATDTGSDVQIEESVADAPTETEEAPTEEPAPEVTQTEALTEESEQQIVIAAEIDTGGGDVAVDAGEDGDVIVGADIDTSDEEDEEAGDVTIEGERIAVVDEATISASANNAGDIKIGGGRQGRDETVSNSQITILAEGTSVEANGGETGDGGSIIVFSEESSLVSGNLSARGGSQSGNGGFIETSGLENLTIESTPDVGASNGDGGEWLIDPNDILITDDMYLTQGSINPDLNVFTSGWSVAPTNTGAVIQISNILDALQTGDVTITTDNGNTGEVGNITVESSYGGFVFDGPVYSGDGNTLTLDANNNIYFNSQIDFTNLSQYSATYSDPVFNVEFVAGGDIHLNEVISGPSSPPYAISTEGSVTINAGGSVFSNINITSGGGGQAYDGIYITAGVDANNFRSLYSHGNISISAGNDVNIEGRVSSYFGSYTDIDILAGREAVIRDSVETYGNISITGGLNMAGDGRVFVLDDLGRNVTVGRYGSTNATESVTISGDFIQIDSISCGTIECGSGVDIIGNDISLSATGNTGDNYSIILQAGADVNNTNLAQGGHVSIVSRNSMNIETQGGGIFISASDTEFIDGQGMRSTHIGRYGQNDYFSNQIILQAEGGTQTIQAQGNLRLQTGLGEKSNVFIHHGRSYYSPSGVPEQSISATNIIATSNGVFAATGEPGSGAMSIHSAYQQTIAATNNIYLYGLSIDAPVNDPYQSSFGPTVYGTTSNLSVTSLAGQTITTGNDLRLNSSEIASIADGDPYAAPADSISSITVNGLFRSVGGRIGLDRDTSTDNSTFTLITNGDTSIDGGVATIDNPDNFALQIDGVTWNNTGRVFWNTGAGDVNITSNDGNPAIVNSGDFFFQSETGVFTIIEETPSGPQAGLFLNENGGVIRKTAGQGVTNLEFETLITSGGVIVPQSGELNFGSNDITISGTAATRDATGPLIAGGDIRTTGIIFIENASIDGGINSTDNSGGGSIIANIQITNSTIRPGFSPGMLTIDGDLDASGGGNLIELEVDATTGLSDQLVVTGNLTLPGSAIDGPANTISVIQTGDFDPDLANPVESSFTLIAAGSGSIDPLAIVNSTADTTITAVENDVDTSPGSLTTTFGREAVAPPVEPPVEEPPVEPPVEEPPVEPPVEEPPVEPPVEEPPVEPPVEEPPVEPPVEEPPVEPPVEEPPVEPPVEEPPVEPPIEEEPQTGGEESQELGSDITDTIVGETAPTTPDDPQQTTLDDDGSSGASDDDTSGDESDGGESSSDDGDEEDSDDDKQTKKKSDTGSAKNSKSKKKKKTPMCSA